MPKFPVDAPAARVLRALETLGFRVVRHGDPVLLERVAADGTKTTMTLPGHRVIKGSTLRTARSLARIDRNDFISAYERA